MSSNTNVTIQRCTFIDYVQYIKEQQAKTVNIKSKPPNYTNKRTISNTTQTKYCF